MTAITAEPQRVGSERLLHTGSVLMSFGAVAFVGYAVIFFVLNFTDRFLELGIGRGQVDVDKNQIQDFRPDLYHYVSHLHIAVSGFLAAAAGTGAWCSSEAGVKSAAMQTTATTPKAKAAPQALTPWA